MRKGLRNGLVSWTKVAWNSVCIPQIVGNRLKCGTPIWLALRFGFFTVWWVYATNARRKRIRFAGLQYESAFISVIWVIVVDYFSLHNFWAEAA